MNLRVVIPGAPIPKGRPRTARGVTYTPERTRAYERTARLLMGAASARARWALAAPGIRLAVTIWVVEPDRRRRDLDNVAKAILDAGNGILWTDDSQVDELHVYRSVDAMAPRVEIEVSVAQPEARGG